MYTVHIIDDNEIYRDAVSKFIEESGFCPCAFTSGQQYLKYMARNDYVPPQAIFSDMNMPDMDGISLIRNIRGKYPNIRCYIITGDIEQFSNQGFQDDIVEEILPKPVEFGHLEKLLEVLGRNA